MAKFLAYMLEVKEKVQDTHDTCTLRFDKPHGFAFMPGQFMTMQFVDAEGNVEKGIRSFTMSSAPGDSMIDITVKATGGFSTRLCDSMPGQKFRLSGPFGNFVLDENEKGKVHFFITGGSGITPYRAFLHHDRSEKLGLKFMLLYSNKTEKDIIFREELDDFEAGNRKIRNFYALTREIPDGWKGEEGRISKDMIVDCIGKKAIEDFIFYLCGPKELINSAIDILKELGAKPVSIRTERWD